MLKDQYLLLEKLINILTITDIENLGINDDKITESKNSNIKVDSIKTNENNNKHTILNSNRNFNNKFY